MKVLRNISPIFSKLVGKQTFESNVKYRPITYLVFAEEDGNNIVYNTFTNMLLQIDTEQKAILKGESYSDSKQIKYFVENWFLVPKDNDDYELCEQTRALVSFVSSVGNPKYDKYTILTTTDCNARCFYCYQIGRDNSRMPMTAKTAEAVAEFIIRNSGTDHPVFITWFGGEPLYNDSVIDLISDRLRESGVKFGSSMISNGYLLTKEIVDRAKSKWNLGSIQIPIDGTEEVYNRC
ncbi:MAG: 4Fe-4S cluster-binding domain-containing protein, partial [Clostridia bacterium]|nr:4Fe-4S cluster-binding domain-containing protein [Clostridia bacterium]